MPYPYFFCNRTSAGTAFFLLALLPTLSTAAEPTEAPSPMSMYFDDSQMVEVATRAPKPMTQVAENVSIVTAEEIEDMHVHTLLEVLERQPGISMAYNGADYGSTGSFYLQGTEWRHTLVLIDGVRLNNASAGEALVNFVPLPIIKRIEIIKGPASSVWGSSLGGVVNIITKDTGTTAVPKASAMVTYGEAASRELNADLAGAAGVVSYYLNAGTMDSNGLKNNRFHDRETVYGKMAIKLPQQMTLSAAAGYSDPYYKTGDFESLDISDTVRNRNFWGTVYFDAPLRDSFSLHLEAQRFDMRHFRENTKLGQSTFAGWAGGFLQSNDYKEQTTAFNGRLFWDGDMVDLTVGAESSRGQLDFTYIYDYSGVGPWIGSEFSPTAYEERRAVYSNATISLGKFAVTPGLRYDYHSIAGEFVSPSLGATYQLADDTLLRGTVARGFSAPALALISGGNAFTPVNPLLKPELVDSVQAGVETFRIPGLQLKANLFHHDVTDVWTATVPRENEGRTRYEGVDLTAKTLPWHDLTLTANGTYAITDSATQENDDLYSTSLVLDYNDHQSLKAQLAGRYIWFNDRETIDGAGNPRIWNTHFIWDASVTKTVGWQGMSTDLFLVVHNLFSSSQYWDYEYPNPDRWVEVGAVFKF